MAGYLNKIVPYNKELINNLADCNEAWKSLKTLKPAFASSNDAGEKSDTQLKT